jgi:hypothetical protein
MPLCPQITNTPITVVQNSDFTVSSVLPVVNATTTQLDAVDADAQQALIDAEIAKTTADAAAAVAASSAAAAAAAQSSANTALSNAATAQSTANAAASAASTAQSTANTALANAATAFTAATGSLQPSANTIVNASNQITAINGGGITVYSGASATTGARVVLNSLGLAGFNSSSTGPSNGATFSISASTGAAVFSGNVTGATITGSDLNIAGVFIVNGTTGVMTATSATVTGEIRATSGYFGTLTNGWSIGSTGLTAVGTGNITGGSIVGTQFTSIGGVFSVSPAGFLIATAGTIGGLTLSGSSITSATGGFSVTSSGVLTAISGTVAGWTLSSTAFTNIAADTFLYANPGTDGLAYSTVGRAIMRRLQLNGASGTTLGTNVLAVGGNTTIDGSTISIGSITTNGSLTVDQSATFGNGTSNPFLYLASSGTLRSLYTYGVARTASTRTMIIDSNGNFGTTASTQRKKHEIESYTIDSSALLQLDVKQFKYKPEFDSEQQIQHGFIAEEAQALGLDELIQYDSTGVPDYFAYEKLPIFLLQLIKELKAEIDQLKGE